MKIGKDISVKFDALYLVHHNIPAKKVNNVSFKEHILFIPLQGEIAISINDKKYCASPGQMIYLAPGISHSFHSSTHGGERLIAMLSPSILKNKEIVCTKLPLNQLIKEILFYLLLHPETKNSKSLVTVFSETLSEAFKLESFTDGFDHLAGKVSDQRIKTALHIMQKTAGVNTSITGIAEKAGLSTRNLNRLMLKETGLSPKRLLNNFRMEQAKTLLRKPSASVTNVALESGYNSLSQFIAAFRSYTGQLPSHYLKHG